jgi:hypothetical protein
MRTAYIGLVALLLSHGVAAQQKPKKPTVLGHTLDETFTQFSDVVKAKGDSILKNDDCSVKEYGYPPAECMGDGTVLVSTVQPANKDVPETHYYFDSNGLRQISFDICDLGLNQVKLIAEKFGPPTGKFVLATENKFGAAGKKTYWRWRLANNTEVDVNEEVTPGGDEVCSIAPFVVVAFSHAVPKARKAPNPY